MYWNGHDDMTDRGGQAHEGCEVVDPDAGPELAGGRCDALAAGRNLEKLSVAGG